MGEAPEELTRRVRLHVYRSFVQTGRAPATTDVCRAFGLTPTEVAGVLRTLESRDSALVLLPDSPYVWMAEPFSAVPTAFPVRAGERAWFGNCIWDALAILALVGSDGRVETLSPLDGEPLGFEVRGGELLPLEAVIHFAVPASQWWRSIGFT